MGELKDDIQKYLEGKLSPSEMHALEKKALNDPFLSDALDGAGSLAPPVFKADAEALDQKLVGKKSAWAVPLRIAASLVLLCGILYFMFPYLNPKEQMAVSKEEPKITSSGHEANTDAKVQGDKKNEADKSLANKPGVKVPSPAKEKRGKALPAGVSKGTDEQEVFDDLTLSEPVGSGTEDEKQPVEKPVATFSGNAPREAAMPASSQTTENTSIVQGKITSAHDGEPIPGASIVVKGTTERVTTDANGYFELKKSSGLENLTVLSPGYETQEIKVPKGESNVYAQMFLDSVTGLSETILVSHQEKRNTTLLLAEPMGGNKAYNKYLRTHVHYPSEAKDKKIEGKTMVEFTIHPDGSLTNFTIIDGLGSGCDEEAIRLVRDGPAWKPSVREGTATSSTVRVQIEFKLPK